MFQILHQPVRYIHRGMGDIPQLLPQRKAGLWQQVAVFQKCVAAFFCNILSPSALSPSVPDT